MAFPCFDCQKEFPSAEALAQHKNTIHGHKSSTSSSGISGGKKALWPWILGILVVIGVIFVYSAMSGGKYDSFAQCISQSGAKFYGAFWCPHCAEQKAMFGSSAQYLPYIECSTSDGKSELQVCQDAGVTGYPTWVFSDGTRGNVMSLEQLAQKTSCALP